jgi:hypothetical protein
MGSDPRAFGTCAYRLVFGPALTDLNVGRMNPLYDAGSRKASNSAPYPGALTARTMYWRPFWT